MDEESKRIIAKAARDHAKYEAQFAGLDYGSSSSETEDTESTDGSYHPDATVDTTYTTETTGLSTAVSTRGGGGGGGAAAEPAVVVSTFDDIANKKVLAQEAEVNSAPPLPRPAGDPSYTETASQVKEVTKVAAGYGVSRRGSGYNSGDEEDEEHRRRREQAEQQRRQAEAEAEALEAERLRNDPSYKETVSQVKEVTKVAAGYGASRRGGGYNSEDEEDEERRRREAAAATAAAEAEAERRRTDPEYDALRRAEEEAERRRNDPSYKETVSQVKEVTKVAAGHGASRRGGGYNSEDEEDEERRRREAAAATAAAAAAAEAERRRTDPEYDAMRRAEEEAERRRNDPEYDAMRRAEEEAERRRRDAAYANETEEERAERLAREASAVEAARVRTAESAMRRQGGRRDGEYEDGVSQVKEVTKVATGVAAGRRGGGYNSEDDEDFSSEGGFEASEESYGGHHFFEGNSGTASGTTGKSSSASEYDDPNFRIHGGARRDEAYDGYGAGSDSISGRSSDRRDLPYGYDGENHSMASSSVAGSSEAYIATAMANETKTSEASRTASLTPIQRAAKRALERDSPYVPLSDLIPAYTENPERLKKALNTPIPYDHGVIQCTLRKRKRLLYFYLQPENRLLMIGYERNKVFSPGLNIMISVVPQPQKKRHEPSYIGKVRSNANFTKFNIYDGGISPKLVGVNKDDPTPPRRELAYVKYDLFPDAPRYMLVMTPRVRDDETWGDFVPHLPKDRDDDDGSMEARYKGGHHQDIEVSYNRKPEWNEKLGRFELDVKNRAQLPSTKNFMISTRLDPNHDSVLMGKAADKVYTISVQYPMTLFQGLTIAITAMYARTYR